MWVDLPGKGECDIRGWGGVAGAGAGDREVFEMLSEEYGDGGQSGGVCHGGQSVECGDSSVGAVIADEADAGAADGVYC